MFHHLLQLVLNHDKSLRMQDYTEITELPESQVIPVQIDRSYSRYKFALNYVTDKDVLEVACGGGQGLGLLATKARRVVGGDYEQKNVAIAKQTYQGTSTIEVVQMDAHQIGYPDKSFDVILIYEAIYYLHSPDLFLQECKRLLRAGGVLIVCTANKNWPDFNPSPYSHQYFSVPELVALCGRQGFSTEVYGAFPDQQDSSKARFRSLIKRTAVALHLMPKTMKGKVLLKRLFFGGLATMPRSFSDGCANYHEPILLKPSQVDTVHTALYAVAKLPLLS